MSDPTCAMAGTKAREVARAVTLAMTGSLRLLAWQASRLEEDTARWPAISRLYNTDDLLGPLGALSRALHQLETLVAEDGHWMDGPHEDT